MIHLLRFFRSLFLILLLLVSSLSPVLFAQEVPQETTEQAGQDTTTETPQESGELPKPDTPALELPPILQELTDKSDAKLEAYIPELDIHLPSLEDEDLPVPTQLDVDEVFTLGEIEISEIPIPSREYGESEEPPWRSNGEIGLGSMSQVTGKIGIHSPGRQNSLDLEFGYNRYDGFQFEQPGSGFFHQDLRLEGGFSTYPEGSYLSFQGLYLETADGLQGNSTSFSEISHRFFRGFGSLILGMEEKAEFFFQVEARGVEQILSGDTPSTGWEIGLIPRVGVDLTLSWFSARLEGVYSLSGCPGFASSVDHLIYPQITLRAELPQGHAIGGTVGTRWFLGGPLLLPFSLSWEGSFPNRWGFSLSGGYRIRENSYYEFWQETPYLSFGTRDPFSAGWFGEGTLSVYPSSELTVEGGLSFDYFIRGLRGISDVNSDTGLVEILPGTFPGLTTNLSVYWDPEGLFSFSLGWRGSFIERSPLSPAQSIHVRAELGDEESRAGGSVSLETRVWETLRMPILQGSAFLWVSDTVRFILTGEDLLAPLINGDRKGPVGYKTSGLRILLSAGISL